MGNADGAESEGFAVLGQNLGAKSVLASLWKVSDVGTPDLMVRFYKWRAEHPDMSKGAAFRRAQLSLLSVATKPVTKQAADLPRADMAGQTPRSLSLPLFVRDAKRPFAHPYYWSSFVLIGNWK
jgi:CHAT domain-containing protein